MHRTTRRTATTPASTRAATPGTVNPRPSSKPRSRLDEAWSWAIGLAFWGAYVWLVLAYLGFA